MLPVDLVFQQPPQPNSHSEGLLHSLGPARVEIQAGALQVLLECPGNGVGRIGQCVESCMESVWNTHPLEYACH